MRFNRWRERSWPYIVGLACGVGMGCMRITSEQFGRLVTDVLPTAITVAAVFAGFQTAAPSILLTIANSKIIRKLRRDGLYDLVVWYIWEAVSVLFVFIVIAAATVLWGALCNGPWPAPSTLTGLTIGLFAASVACSVRITGLMIKLLRVDANAPGETDGPAEARLEESGP